MNGGVALNVVGLGKRYRIRGGHRPTNVTESAAGVLGTIRHGGRGRSRTRDFWALRDVSFAVSEGDVLGIIGPNGAGKSTLLKLLSRVTEPTEGRAEIFGRVSSLLEVGTGFHPELSGRDNVYLNGAVLGMRRAEIQRRFDDIVEFSGVSEFIDVPVKRYSSGMFVRLAFAVAAHLDPDVLLVDEVLAVGDRAFQDRCLGRLKEVARSGRTVVFVSHDMNAVRSLCRRGILLDQGAISFDGPIERTMEAYLRRRPALEGGNLADAERRGTGELRFREARVTNERNEPFLYAGGPILFHLGFAAERPVSGAQLVVGLGIDTALGVRLATLSTQFDPTHTLSDVELGETTSLTCRVDDLPLRPGKYVLTLAVSRTGEFLDLVESQVEFEVMPSDFYGTGALPSERDGGPVLLRQTWKAEPSAHPSLAARPATEASARR